MLDPPAKEEKEGSEPAALEQQPKGHMGCPPKECKNRDRTCPCSLVWEDWTGWQGRTGPLSQRYAGGYLQGRD